MSDIYYFAYQSDRVYEGGMARNYAFFIRFKSITNNIFNVYSDNKVVRIIRSCKCLVLLIFVRNKKIFIHQGSILVLFPVFLFKIKIFRNIIESFLIFISKNNYLFVEINDIPYEQSIDLQLEIKNEFIFFQNILYSLKNVSYVFASHQMRNYISSKYEIDLSLTQVIINGGPELNNGEFFFDHQAFKQKDKIICLYAGSLNEGRNVNDIISLFKEKSNFILVLMGNDGRWLEDNLLPENVYYLGNFNEDTAHQITALCDIGLLPYDDNKFYYNLCYPTKVSFYITAGLPVLSTPLRELQEVFADSDCIDFVAFNKWRNYLNNLNDLKLMEMKDNAEKQRNKFIWPVILDSLSL